MKAATVHEIKQELGTLKPAELVEICQRLARFKKENKELLTYLLFEAHHEEGYVESVKQEIDGLFETVNPSHLYFAKKTLRKIVRIINKYARYSGRKQSEIEWRIYFCKRLKDSGIPFYQNKVTANLYEGQLKKIGQLFEDLHEDLQHDYRKEIEPLLEQAPVTKKFFSFFRR
ncbi:MAG TPA: hypothetical protein VFX58_11925 [Chitinophagaceae bacterium]|nr:hypothetical protein [Chitinophagaceae bacterium]